MAAFVSRDTLTYLVVLVGQKSYAVHLA
jgi:hypothetical protein